MVVGLHVRKYSGYSLEEAASFSVDEDCPDIESDLSIPKKQRDAKRQRRRVSFQAIVTAKTIPNTDDLTEQEKAEAFFSHTELQLIRMELRTIVLLTNQELACSGAKALTPEQEEKLRGLEVYVEPAKHATMMRKQRAKDAVFQNDCDADWIAKKYQEVSVSASEIAHKLGLMDEQQAWSTNEDDNSDRSARRAPLYSIMIR
jgi:hypothetical protein